MLTTAAAAAIALAGSAAPALADDGGNSFCFLSTGSLTATVTGASSPHPIEVQWNVSAPYCTAYTVYVSGPGFTPGAPAPDGGLQFTYLPSGTTGTWTLSIVDLDSGNDTSYQLATASVTGPA